MRRIRPSFDEQALSSIEGIFTSRTVKANGGSVIPNGVARVTDRGNAQWGLRGTQRGGLASPLPYARMASLYTSWWPQLVTATRMKKQVPVNEKGCRIGQHHHNAVLTDSDVELVRILRERDGKPYGWLALKFEVHKSTIAAICQYKRRAQTVAGWKTVTSRKRRA